MIAPDKMVPDSATLRLVAAAEGYASRSAGEAIPRLSVLTCEQLKSGFMQPFVKMVHSADFWKSDDSAD